MKRKGFWILSVIAPAIILSFQPFPGWTYDNQGPHQAINKWALKIFSENFSRRPEFKRYSLAGEPASRKLRGEGIVRKGDLYEWDQQWLLSNVTGFFQKVQPGDRDFTWVEWIEDGGFTADEPELWQALRHFYDPTVADPARRNLIDFKDWGLWAAKNVGNMFLDDPRIDALEWAVEGPPRPKFQPNPYAWNRGVDFMRRAFYSTDSPADKDRLFAAAWRALGETMHLLADMTVPAHVRNDSHPGVKLPYFPEFTKDYGSLKRDPYEKAWDTAAVQNTIDDLLSAGKKPFTAEDLRSRLDGGLASGIDGAGNLEQAASPDQNIRNLFYAVASYTNANFFSQDTFFGNLEGKRILPANGLPAYAKPRLEDGREEKDWRVRILPDGREVRMGRRDILSTSGWSVDGTVALSQGTVLLPVALYADMKLADWFIPRITVKIELDGKKKKLSGSIVSVPYGPYTGSRTLVYNKPRAWREGISLIVDGERQDPREYDVQIEKGVIDGDLRRMKKLGDFKEHSVELEIDMGGIGVRSEPAKMMGAPAFRLVGSYFTGPALTSMVTLPRDLGKMTNWTAAWSDYSGQTTLMTATGEAKGFVYLQERVDRESQRTAWFYALIIPPEAKPGIYSAALNYYLDGRGPFTVPVDIQARGEGREGKVIPDSAAQANLDYFLNDLKSQIETAGRQLEKEKAFDVQKALADNAASKLRKRAEYQAAVKRYEQSIRAGEQDILGSRAALAKASDPEAGQAIKSSIQNAEIMMERDKKEIDRTNTLLNTLEETYKRREEEILLGHEDKLKAWGRIKQELEEWEAAVRLAQGK